MSETYTPLSGEVLEANGFRYEARTHNTFYWRLSLGAATVTRLNNLCADDLTLEVHPGRDTDGWWMVFLARDRTHHVCLGDFRTWEQVKALVEGVTRRPFDPECVVYASLMLPHHAQRIKADYEEAQARLPPAPAKGGE